MSGKKPTFVQMDVDHLHRIFRREKARDLRQSQFETEKTARIQALCSAFASTSVGGERQRLLDELMEVFHSKYPIAIDLY